MVRWLRGRREEYAGIVLMVLLSVATVLAAHGGTARAWTALAMAAAEAGLILGRHAPPSAALTGLVVAVAAGSAALLLASSGLAEVPILVAAARLPRVLPPRRRVAVVVTVALLFGVEIAVISGSVVGLLAGYGVWLLAQRTVQSAALEAERDRAVLLLAEVEASRDAQAEAAAGAERARIARDMHDVLAHSLAGLSLQLQAVRAVAVREGVADAVTVPLQRAADLAREGVAEARAAVGVLRDPAAPVVADGPGAHGIAGVADLVARFPGSATHAVTGAAQPLSPAAGHAVYRAVQESLTNAARYAPGAPVAVALDWSATRLVATVSDEGAARTRHTDPLDADPVDADPVDADPVDADLREVPGPAAGPGRRAGPRPGDRSGGVVPAIDATRAAAPVVSARMTGTEMAGTTKTMPGAPAAVGVATGSGLAGMAERLGLVGGRLAAGPAGDGWVVRIVVPTEEAGLADAAARTGGAVATGPRGTG